ncbi:hypothetical protein BCS96_14395 [Vibrio breoganii]|uniref:DUF3634 family protein n=1 Tax=Vibrio breoganii TaxID=553239 RepID=UPI000C855768|nr:DUF3634 family protein [Vibrio breoganii]PML82587.1 hypothetical protein BCT68_12245 [Vibrio breoganii]PMM41346.1 hypothetical protein BCT52_01765 [Vibrio breoganii]PMO91076.1 hypothetical protein BCS98_13205 [Vibrio breoganii]PMO96775.1 hypothetical protein BCS96_14395 [Vibrio breoganii]
MLYVILIAAALIFAIVLYDKPKMKLTFKEGEVSSHIGQVDKSFLHKCKDIARKNPFNGTMKVYKSREQYRVKFSKGVPNKTRHILRSALPGAKSPAHKR